MPSNSNNGRRTKTTSKIKHPKAQTRKREQKEK